MMMTKGHREVAFSFAGRAARRGVVRGAGGAQRVVRGWQPRRGTSVPNVRIPACR
jgi:hypothetical protein